jgi:hypothetical protein
VPRTEPRATDGRRILPLLKLTWGYYGPRALQQQSTGLIRSGVGCES